MYSKLKRALLDPMSAIGFSRNIIYNKVANPVLEKILYTITEEPTNQLVQDWDVLIILDACRYDTFSEISNLPGDLEFRISPASSTYHWLDKTVNGNEFYDTVYVSANPRTHGYSNHFHEMIDVWDWGFDEDLKVAHPEKVSEATRNATEKYPNKRIVAHFMQPHTPFIGEYARNNIGIGTGDQPARARAHGENVDSEDWTIETDLLEQGETTYEQVMDGYRENLEIVLTEVESLMRDLEGKIIVTADHGEMFGEVAWPFPKKVYAHPGSLASVKLRKVPWLVHNDGKRPQISSENPQRTNKIDDGKVSERLKYLGYTDNESL